jgi:hypothetical protein
MADNGSDSSNDQSQSRWKKGLQSAGRSLSSWGQGEMSSVADSRITPVSYHRGGKVRKGGKARLLKGERVIPKGKTKRVEKMMRKAKMRMKSRKGGR